MTYGPRRVRYDINEGGYYIVWIVDRILCIIEPKQTFEVPVIVAYNAGLYAWPMDQEELDMTLGRAGYWYELWVGYFVL